MSLSGFIILVVFIIFSSILYLISDYLGPKKIITRPENAFGLTCLRARDLIVQEYDTKGNLWATRGHLIYYLGKGEDKFIKVARVPSGFSFYWLNNFTIIRKITLRPECIEMTVSKDGHICAFSSGIMWISQDIGKRFIKTMRLPNYGIKVGRGIMSTGILQVGDQEFLFGEYFSNPKRVCVRIYRYKSFDNTWKISYKFLPGQIRHIHALQRDPFTEKLWICTGDENNEAVIGWSEDDFKSIVPIGQGSQIWRTCQLVFTKEAILWGTDTGSEDLAGIYHWDRKNKELIRLQKTDGAVFFGTLLTKGTIVMSMDREGFPNEKDDITRLIILGKEDKIITIPCGTWKYNKSGFRFNFAKLRFQRDQGNDSLGISVLNHKEFPDGELLLFKEEDLVASF